MTVEPDFVEESIVTKQKAFMNSTTLLRVLLFTVILFAVFWLAYLLGFDIRAFTPERMKNFVLSYGVWAPVIYILVYGQPIVPLPASIMTVTAGLAFGPFWGTLGALAGANIRASGQFVIARWLGRDVVAKLLRGKVAQLDRKVGENGFSTVFLIRLVPNVPFDMQNYTLGVSKIRFTDFASATALAMIPGTIALVYLGHSFTDPANIWKAVLAILAIIGLVFWQRSWKKTHKDMSEIKVVKKTN